MPDAPRVAHLEGRRKGSFSDLLDDVAGSADGHRRSPDGGRRPCALWHSRRRRQRFAGTRDGAGDFPIRLDDERRHNVARHLARAACR